MKQINSSKLFAEKKNTNLSVYFSAEEYEVT